MSCSEIYMLSEAAFMIVASIALCCLLIYLFLHLTTSYDALGDKTQDKDITSLIFSNADK